MKKFNILLVILLFFVSSSFVKAGNVFSQMTNPDPNSNNLTDISGSDNGHIFTVGFSGTILRGDGANWNLETSPTSQDLYSVVAISSTNAWACGTNATLVHYNGASWSIVVIPGAAENFWDIFAFSANDIYVCGDACALYHYNGSSWSKINLGLSDINICAISGSSSSDVYLVGYQSISPYNGEVIHYNGSSAAIEQDVTDPLGFGNIWSNDFSTYYIAGGNGIYKYESGSNNLSNIQSINYGDMRQLGTSILFCGDPTSYNIALYDGVSSWQVIGNYHVGRVYSANDPSNVYFVGVSGKIYHLDMTSGINEQSSVATHFQAFPNPAVTDISIAFDNAGQQTIGLELYNNLGQKVVVLSEPQEIFGNKSISYDVSTLPRGLYFIRALIGNRIETQKLILIE